MEYDISRDENSENSFKDSISKFIQLFPEGFYDEQFSLREREYKLKAHNLAINNINKQEYENLLQNGDYEEIYKRALKIINSTNMLHYYEIISLKNGLAISTAKEKFCKALYQFLHSQEDLDIRFKQFSKVLEDIDAAKWPTISFFLYIMFPENYMFVKPNTIKNIAKYFAFEINYSPNLNWLTYKSILELSEYIKKNISELKPRDMIDIQSFMWCIYRIEQGEY